MYQIITDTSANLPTPYLQQHHITVLPFTFIVNGEERVCLDTERFDAGGYYHMIQEGAAVRTSQVTPEQYVQAMRPFLEQGTDIIFIGMSSGISGSFNSSEVAANQLREEFPGRQIRLVDTLGASLGEGLLVMRAVEMREKGARVTEVADRLLTLRDYMCQVFTVDDLMHLRRTGRCSNIKAVVATALRIKPLLKGNPFGQIVIFGKAIGRRRSIQMLAEQYAAHVRKPELQVVGIAHADCLEDAEYLAELLRQKNAPKDILIVDYEPVTGSHVGPGALALFFLGDKGFRAE